MVIYWLGEEDSNPRKQVQSLSSYHWTIPQFVHGPSTISKTLTGVKAKNADFPDPLRNTGDYLLDNARRNTVIHVPHQ